jgi:hypothetical protein
MFKKLAIMLAIMLAMSGAASAAMYYVIYNVVVEVGSTGETGDVVDVTGLNSSGADGYFHLLRIYSIANGQTLNVPKACSKLTLEQWNVTEMNTGGYDGALEFYAIDRVDLMY